MLLAIDCGNTHVVFGIFNHSKLSYSWRVETSETNNKQRFFSTFLKRLEIIGLNLNQITDVIFASVVLEAADCFNFLENSIAIPFRSIMDPSIILPIDIDLPDPSQVGADRIVNAVAGSLLTQSDVIIVDFGTATTFDVVHVTGGRPIYKGGIIAPGVNLSIEALSKAASKLPKINLNNHPEYVQVIGTNTQEAMWSGIIWGYVGLIEGIIQKIKIELDCEFEIIATGGLAKLYFPYCDLIKIQEPDLILVGLQHIARINGYE